MTDVVLAKTPCSSCLYTKCILGHVAVGTALPTVLSLMGTANFLTYLAVRGVPDSFASKEFVDWSIKMCRKSKGFLLGCAVLQAATSSFILMKQREQWEWINSEMYNTLLKLGKIKPPETVQK